MDRIPGESDRDRRLRLRALERKTRLGSAKSNYSAYSNPAYIPPPTSYQENVKFPENTELEMNAVKPAKPMNFDRSEDFKSKYDSHERPEFEFHPNKQFDYSTGNRSENHPESVKSSAETL